MAGLQHVAVMLVALLLCWTQASAASAGGGRKLLSCMGNASPRYHHEDGTSLPLCVTQFFPSGTAGQFNRVTPDTQEPVSGAKSADLAHAWSTDATNPRTDSRLQCSGEVDPTPRQCWSGKAVETDGTFSSISCCSSSVSCYIKSGAVCCTEPVDA